MNDVVLEVVNLHTYFKVGKKRTVKAVDGVSLYLRRGEILGLVGESGSGKSVTARSILRLVPPGGIVRADRISLDGVEVQNLSARAFRRVRGTKLSMIFQEPLTALNPSFTIGWQIREVYRLHRKELSLGQRRERAVDMLERVRIPDAEKREKEYPHQFSGGMRQRGLISIALASEPEILIADEPTTALDVTVQADIMDLIEELRQDMKLAVLFISHNLNLITQRCDRVMVMYAGQVMEEATSEQLLLDPRHPYTVGLLGSIPDIDHPDRPLHSIPGDIADLSGERRGCPFHPRCGSALPVCAERQPPWTEVAQGHWCACHLCGQDGGDGDD